METSSKKYSDYYLPRYNTWWRFWTPVEIPFKFLARRICKGQTLDIGCGPGRYLSFLPDAIGLDHNAEMVKFSLSRGYKAYTTEEFAVLSPDLKKQFETLLLSHVIEHMSFESACYLISNYLPLLKERGRLVVIVPQGKAFTNDPTHICYFDDKKICSLAANCGLRVVKTMHHPFPEFFNPWLINDTIYILKSSEKPATTAAYRK